MIQLATDNFNRSNESPLSDGGNWSLGYNANGGLQVVSDACENIGPGINLEYWSGLNWPSDHYSEYKFTNSVVTYNADLVVRLQENAGVWSGYVIFIGSTVGSNNLILRYYSNFATNSFSTLTTTPSSFLATPLTTDTWRLSVTGSTLTVTQNGTTVLTATDTNLTGGAPGLYMNGAANSNLKITLWNGGANQAATRGVITADMSTKYQARIFTSRAARSISGPRKTEVRTKPS